MREFQVEVGFSLRDEDGEVDRNFDLLASFGQELESLAGNMGPSTAIIGGHYIAMLTVEAEAPIDAAGRATDLVNEAVRRALAEHGHEFAGRLLGRDFDRLHVAPAELTAV